MPDTNEQKKVHIAQLADMQKHYPQAVPYLKAIQVHILEELKGKKPTHQFCKSKPRNSV
tara:strand:- start:938 stop:1114 length:177 start_codon:yes stop_codon:yes gene_type:complete